jgi:integrase
MLRERAEHPRAAIHRVPLTTGGFGVLAGLPSRTRQLRDRRNTAGDIKDLFDFCGFYAASSHLFRRSVATIMDASGLSARAGADQLGHRQLSMTMDRYWGRGLLDTGAAEVLEALGS